MQIANALKESGIPVLDAEVLLAAALNKDRTWLLGHPEQELSRVRLEQFIELTRRRREGEPVAYLTGEKEFYGRMFSVNPHVLIPRPSTEGLIELALDFLRSGRDEVREIDTEIVGVAKKYSAVQDVSTIVDIGTGCGCIAITLKLERPDLNVIATDSSVSALEVAKENARGLCADIDSRVGDGLEPVLDVAEPFIIVSNPPYIPVPVAGSHESSLRYEPREALYAGFDGKDIINGILRDAKKHTCCRGIVLECRKDQC